MYLHEQTCSIITLLQIFEIVYELNIINIPVFKKLVHLVFAHNPLFLHIMQWCIIYCQKPFDPSLTANEVRQNLS